MVGEPDANEETPESTERAPETDIDAAAAWARDHWRIVIVIAAALLLAIACRKMQYNPDSIHYVDMARTIAEDQTVASWHLTLKAQRVPQTTLYWPPLYPMLLAGFMVLGLPYYVATWAVAVAAGTLAIYLLVFWFRHPALTVPLVLAFIYLYFDSGVAFRAWSEVPYLPIIFGAMLCMSSAIAGASARRSLMLGVAAGALAGAAALTRHMGLAMIPTLGLVVLLAPEAYDEETGELSDHRWHAALGAVIGLAVALIPWLVRNLVMNGQLFGISRPPSERTLSELAFWTGAMLYLDLGPILLALIFAAAGYHLEKQPESVQRETFTSSVMISGLSSAAIHAVLILTVHLLFQLDEPPTKRFFFPVFASLLFAAAAVISRAEPPKLLTGRRAVILMALAAPIVLGPMFSNSVVTDVTPRSTSIDRWIIENTEADDLVVANRGWAIRFHTGRPVLESGMIADPPISDGEKVASFLERFGDRFGNVYVVVEAEDPGLLVKWNAAGIMTERVASFESTYHLYKRSGSRTVEIHRAWLRDNAGR
ncbi:MAG: hypothetical protein GF393_05835 [Armatimonadia bacterium]|nr:hypothetical protein [Armatimonadia bacterium]